MVRKRILILFSLSGDKMLKKRFYKFCLYIIVFLIFIAVYYFLFYKNGIVIPCIFNKITGFYCPGCGITRMIISLVKLEFYQAFRYNCLLFIAFPFILFLIFDALIKSLFEKDNYFFKKINNKIWIFLLIIVILFGILRNISIFDYLVPTVI